ncbi:hypothetical protein BESEP5_00198 [Staphylococcus phage vB_SepM_BE05]|nr:hypothetical protein BESEP5_00198 [Staphylococcus phage vB_SepM_BE05]
MRELELESIIENLEMELEFQDLTKKEEAEAKREIKKAKKELEELQK